MEGPIRPISSPEEELAYLRAQVEAKERELASREHVVPREHVVHERLQTHKLAESHVVLAPEYKLPDHETHALSLNLDPEDDDQTMEELRTIMQEKGIKNAFAVLEKINSPHLEDDFHRFLVQYLMAGMPITGITEREPAWKALHMTLYQIALPDMQGDDAQGQKPLKELISSMEQFYAGMLAVEHTFAGEPPYFSLELAVPVNRPHLYFFAAVPNSRKDLFEKQVLAVFPNAVLTIEPNDYNIFAEGGEAIGSQAEFYHQSALPLKDYSEFDYDPLNTVLNVFSKIAPEGEGASLQIIIEPRSDRFAKHYRKILDALRHGEHRSKALSIPESFVGEAARDITRTVFGNEKKREEERAEIRTTEANKIEIELLEKKTSAPIVATTIRVVASSLDPSRANAIVHEMESAFNQFEHPHGNRLIWKRPKQGSQERAFFHDYSFRIFSRSKEIPLSLKELTSLYHFPPKGIDTSPHLKQSRFTQAPAPMDLPREGLVLGVNNFRGQETTVRLAPPDRLRHLYVIGQTGTGKTSFMKTLIEQDIKNGEGVCFIDPHGTDILDILSIIPPERFEDVIYFDPAYIDRPFGLNLLEYDPRYPEQKTFIVNEILAIFRRLYGDVPESMGPAFEQYFRNATMLIMEDPASGSTLMDIGRVLSDESFRNMKLSRSMNPVVNQFWNEIATKAEGEASLQNIVPYITNKFDDFTANDFMRPIIGQQESSFKFREVIDSKKILLVNLSKGRLGERNANLIGLILVGKLFMAALSRADSPTTVFPPFYLYIDEFQNITTDSIPGILSEARKYKLSLTIAHQYLAQVDEKIRNAVFGNVGSMAIFRVGEEDGAFFEKQFAPVFKALDFVNVENYNAYSRLLVGGVPQKPFNFKSLPPAKGNIDQVDDLRELSYLTYGRDRATVEGMIRERYLS